MAISPRLLQRISFTLERQPRKSNDSCLAEKVCVHKGAM